MNLDAPKIDIVWAAVVGPVTSMEVAESTGFEANKVSAMLHVLHQTGRIERAPFRVSSRTASGMRTLGAWVYYENEQRPVERPMSPERAAFQLERDTATAAGLAFNAWLATR